MPTIPSLNDLLHAETLRQQIEDIKGVDSPVIDLALSSAISVIAARVDASEKAAAIRADADWSDEGKQRRLEKQLVEPYRAISKIIAALAVAVAKHEGAAPTLPTIAPTDAAGASADVEIRSWLRSLPPVERDKTLANLDKIDARILNAVARAPSQLSGTHPLTWSLIVERALDRMKPDCVATWRVEAKALSLAVRISVDALADARRSLGIVGQRLATWEAETLKTLRKPEMPRPAVLDAVQTVVISDSLDGARRDLAGTANLTSPGGAYSAEVDAGRAAEAAAAAGEGGE
jgi:hypothetical protein